MLKRVAAVKPLNRQAGFTLIELLVAMALSLVVLGATLTVLSAYTHQSSINQQNNDAQDRARVAIDRVVWDLRNIASPLSTPKLLERATPYDLVFQTIRQQIGSNTSGDERVRYCIPNDTGSGSPSNEVLYAETQTWNTSTAPADPWTSDPTVTIPCPDSPLPAGVTSARLANSVTNRYPGTNHPSCQSTGPQPGCPAFSYNSGTLDGNQVLASDLSKVTTVQVDLFVNPTPTQPSRESELRSNAFLRNQTHQPVSQFTYTPQGGGSVLLNGATSYSPDGYNLNYSWSCVSQSCPNASTLAASTDGLVSWQPGPGAYTIQLVVTDPNGLSGTSQQTVTIT
jgi:prepilin-type N-terminal cleavage/methylation domain-containing protein